MPKTDKEITAMEFLSRATRFPLGPRLYKAAKMEDENKGIEEVKKLMVEERVKPAQIKNNARWIYENTRALINNADIPEPGTGGQKY
jgi:hypothetical protein